MIDNLKSRLFWYKITKWTQEWIFFQKSKNFPQCYRVWWLDQNLPKISPFLCIHTLLSKLDLKNTATALLDEKGHIFLCSRTKIIIFLRNYVIFSVFIPFNVYFSHHLKFFPRGKIFFSGIYRRKMEEYSPLNELSTFPGFNFPKFYQVLWILLIYFVPVSTNRCFSSTVHIVYNLPVRCVTEPH